MRATGDRGSVTAELAVALPVLSLLTTVAIAAVGVAGARVRAQDAAREAARSAARGDAVRAASVARKIDPRAQLVLGVHDDTVTAEVTLRVHPLGTALGAVTIGERAVAALEPGVSP